MSWHPGREDYKGGIGWAIWFIVIALVLIIGGVLLSFVGGWLNAPNRLLGAPRVETLSREANDRYSALEAQLYSIETVRTQIKTMEDLYGEDMSKWPQGKSDEYLQLKQQEQNRIAAYNSSCGQYNALWGDRWREIPTSITANDLPRSCDLYLPN